MEKRSDYNEGDLLFMLMSTGFRKVSNIPVPTTLKIALDHKERLYFVTGSEFDGFCTQIKLKSFYEKNEILFPLMFMDNLFINFGKVNKGFNILWLK